MEFPTHRGIVRGTVAGLKTLAIVMALKPILARYGANGAGAMMPDAPGSVYQPHHPDAYPYPTGSRGRSLSDVAWGLIEGAAVYAAALVIQAAAASDPSNEPPAGDEEAP